MRGVQGDFSSCAREDTLTSMYGSDQVTRGCNAEFVEEPKEPKQACCSSPSKGAPIRLSFDDYVVVQFGDDRNTKKLTHFPYRTQVERFKSISIGFVEPRERKKLMICSVFQNSTQI